jgi:hypothetical protein
MATSELLDIDPRMLRLPPSSLSGADPANLQRQVARFGKSVIGMPRLVVYRGSDGELIVYDGVTRATRVAKLLPGQTVPLEVIGNLSSPGARFPLGSVCHDRSRAAGDPAGPR